MSANIGTLIAHRNRTKKLKERERERDEKEEEEETKVENEKHWSVEPSSWGEERSRRRQRGWSRKKYLAALFFFFLEIPLNWVFVAFIFYFSNSGPCFTVDFFKFIGDLKQCLTCLRIGLALFWMKPGKTPSPCWVKTFLCQTWSFFGVLALLP